MKALIVDASVLIAGASLFYLFFTSAYAPLLLDTSSADGGSLYQLAYKYSPFVAFVFVILVASFFARKGILHAAILGTVTVSIWPAQTLIKALAGKCCEGFGVGVLTAFVPIIAFCLSLLTGVIVTSILEMRNKK